MRLIALFFFALPFTVLAQVNQVDSKGRKQGNWEKKYENGNLRFTGQFKNDVPVGTFVYYYENQIKKAENVF